MGTQTASSIINKAAIVLFDVNNTKWSRAELLGWLNDAQRALVALVPEASSKTTSVKMVAGARQTLPADAYMLLEISRNMGANGTTPGRVPRRIDRALLDESSPDWASASQTAAITAYMYNMRDRLAYYVNPPSDASFYLEVIYSAHPPTLVETDTVLVADIFVPALLDYLLWRANSKSAPFAGGFEVGQAYYKSFMTYVMANSADSARLATDMGNPEGLGGQRQGSVG